MVKIIRVEKGGSIEWGVREVREVREVRKETRRKRNQREDRTRQGRLVNDNDRGGDAFTREGEKIE